MVQNRHFLNQGMVGAGHAREQFLIAGMARSYGYNRHFFRLAVVGCDTTGEVGEDQFSGVSSQLIMEFARFHLCCPAPFQKI